MTIASEMGLLTTTEADKKNCPDDAGPPSTCIQPEQGASSVSEPTTSDVHSVDQQTTKSTKASKKKKKKVQQL